MMPDAWTPPRAAHRLTHVLNAYAAAHGTPRFPVDVDALALEAANVFGWNDPITELRPAPIRHFEGALFPDDARQRWFLFYNPTITSPGRIRFTKGHELGHYLLHRQGRASFECTEQDMLTWSEDTQDIEAQADLFASTLLMPLDDLRAQITQPVDFDLLGHCADRYGTSLTATTLRWLDATDENAVLVVSRDGFMRWAHSSKRAMRAGAFFRTRASVVAVPDGSRAADTRVEHDRRGTLVPATTWFAHADISESLREFKLCADQYDWIMSLLILPRHARVWPPWESQVAD